MREVSARCHSNSQNRSALTTPSGPVRPISVRTCSRALQSVCHALSLFLSFYPSGIIERCVFGGVNLWQGLPTVNPVLGYSYPMWWWMGLTEAIHHQTLFAAVATAHWFVVCKHSVTLTSALACVCFLGVCGSEV